jgi:hypothetical protein
MFGDLTVDAVSLRAVAREAGGQVHFDTDQFFGFGVTITERELGQHL